MAQLTYSVAEAADALGISRSLAYEQVKKGSLPSVRIGKRVVVPKAALTKFLAEMASCAQSALTDC